MEKQSLRRKHGADIWGASGSSLAALWEASGMVLGVVEELFRDPGHQEAPGGPGLKK